MSPATVQRGETAAHRALKRSAVLWAQAQGYSACALEVSLPQCRFRADVVAYRPSPNETTAIFECKQARPDLRRDNCCTVETRERLDTVQRRRVTIEKHLRVHYPSLRVSDSLFPEFDSHNFEAIPHRGYARVLRDLRSLQNRLYDCTKFETLVRYRCANLFFLVVPRALYRTTDVPVGWGALVVENESITLAQKPAWHETPATRSLTLLHRIARAGTRALNRQLEITFEEVLTERSRTV